MKKPRHRWFYYKHGFSPELVHYFISNYSIPNNCLVDPFCGVGTAPITASELGLTSYGFDVSPLPIEICLAKISNPDIDKIKKNIGRLLKFKLYKEDIDAYYLKNRLMNIF